MEYLRPLIKLLSSQKIRQIEILSEHSNMSVKSKLLYDGILNDSFKNDKQASLKLYSSDENHAAYRKLKYRLKKRLINTVFFIDVQQYSNSPYQKALNSTYKNYAAAKIILDKGPSHVAIDIMENALKQTLKYDLTELSILLLKDIKLHYGLYNYNKYKYNRYKSLFEELTYLFNLKSVAEKLYIELGHIIGSNKTFEYNDNIKSAELELATLYKKIKDIDSYYLKNFYFNATYFAMMIKGDYLKQLEIANQAINYFQTKKDFKLIAQATFFQMKGVALLNLKEATKAFEVFEECLNFKPKAGKLYWQSLHNYLFICHALNQDYLAAYEIISKVMNNKSFVKIYDDFKQSWYLKEAFIQFLIRVDKINLGNTQVDKLRPFRIGRFLNEVPEFTKDKRGLNITIHIIQMLFLIVDEKYDAVLDKLSALKQYNFRYLKGTEYARPRNFIKMLLKIPDGNYNANRIRLKAHKYHQILLASPMDFTEKSMSIEIIPYEQLWEEILSIFEK